MSDSPTFQLEGRRDCVIVTLLPALNQIPWSVIEQVGTQIIEEVSRLSVPKVIVDLTPLQYMGSAQVALVVRIFKTVKEKGGTLVVVNQHPQVEEVLTLAGLNKLWTIVRTRDEAESRMGVKTSSAADRSGWLLAGVGLAAVLMSLTAFAAHQRQWTAWPEATLLVILLASAGTAFAVSLITIITGCGFPKRLAIAELLVSVGLLLFGVYHLSRETPRPVATNQVATGKCLTSS